MTLHSAVLMEKLRALDEYAGQLERHRGLTAEALKANLDLLWLVEHGMQLAIQCEMDICARLVVELKLGNPATPADAAELLCHRGVLPRRLLPTLVGMFRFRNVLVHEYTKVDVAKVADNLSHLDDFSDFATCIREFLKRNTPASEPI